ncbi:hypothetical protein [Rheinheimera sp. SA_1]|uniref:hypothetical protein n=1 Tax=Rheinheimera sp. SA_1 TaxID=1827365 RepID=UPI000B27BBEF|nr:hypothetical protein [Rheinheimera sp. SA_1]
MNQIRNYLHEFDIVIMQSRAVLTQIFPEVAEDAALLLLFRQSIAELADTLLD